MFVLTIVFLYTKLCLTSKPHHISVNKCTYCYQYCNAHLSCPTANCLECYYHESFGTVESPDNKCTAASSGGFCYGEFTIKDDGNVTERYICGKGSTSFICTGKYNGARKYYECCNGTDLCNKFIDNPFRVNVTGPSIASTGTTSGLVGMLYQVMFIIIIIIVGQLVSSILVYTAFGTVPSVEHMYQDL